MLVEEYKHTYSTRSLQKKIILLECIAFKALHQPRPSTDPSSQVLESSHKGTLTFLSPFPVLSCFHPFDKLDPLLGIPSHLSKILTSASSLRLKALWSDVSRRIIPFLHGPWHSAHPFIKKHYPIFKLSTYPSKPTVSRLLKTAIIFSCVEQRRKTICSAHPKGTSSCHC